MKLMLNDTSVQMLLALLRASLHELEPEQNFFQGVSPDDWKKCYKLSARHGVMALAWDSVMKLPKDLQPPRPVKLPWASAVEAYEQKYPLLQNKLVLCGSDAHYLWDIRDANAYFDLEDEPYSGDFVRHQLFLRLKGDSMR